MIVHDIFVSHSWKYDEAYLGLRDLLDSAAPGFQYRDHSVPKNDPIVNAPRDQQLVAALTARIRKCQVVLMVGGQYASHSEWIEEELIITKKDVPRPVIGVIPRGAEQVSMLVQGNADRVVGWNADSIVAAIRALSQPPAATDRQP